MKLKGEIFSVRAHKTVIFISVKLDVAFQSLENFQIAVDPSTKYVFNNTSIYISFSDVSSILTPGCIFIGDGKQGLTRKGERTLFATEVFIEKLAPVENVIHRLIEIKQNNQSLEDFSRDISYSLCSDYNLIIQLFDENLTQNQKTFIVNQIINNIRGFSDGLNIDERLKKRDRAQWIPTATRIAVDKWESELFSNGALFQVEEINFEDSSIDDSIDKLIERLPDSSDERRLTYLRSKKLPQINWMKHQVSDIITSSTNVNYPNSENCIIDVGGGRGDLALALALSLPNFSIVVIDVNSKSLDAGKSAASLQGVVNIDFLEGDIRDTGLRKRIFNEFKPKLIVGLHACGGLTDCLLDLAINTNASFVVCTCCFKSQPDLYAFAHNSWKTELGQGKVTELFTGRNLNDMNSVESQNVVNGFEELQASALANGHFELSRRAATVLNSARIFTIQKLWEKKYGTSIPLRVHLASFPSKYSACNQVLIGQLGILLVTLQQSRNAWTSAVFEKCTISFPSPELFDQPTSLLNAPQSPNNSASKSFASDSNIISTSSESHQNPRFVTEENAIIDFLGNANVIIGPHTFPETRFYKISQSSIQKKKDEEITEKKINSTTSVSNNLTTEEKIDSVPIDVNTTGITTVNQPLIVTDSAISDEISSGKNLKPTDLATNSEISKNPTTSTLPLPSFSSIEEISSLDTRANISSSNHTPLASIVRSSEKQRTDPLAMRSNDPYFFPPPFFPVPGHANSSLDSFLPFSGGMFPPYFPPNNSMPLQFPPFVPNTHESIGKQISDISSISLQTAKQFKMPETNFDIGSTANTEQRFFKDYMSQNSSSLSKNNPFAAAFPPFLPFDPRLPSMYPPTSYPFPGPQQAYGSSRPPPIFFPPPFFPYGPPPLRPNFDDRSSFNDFHGYKNLKDAKFDANKKFKNFTGNRMNRQKVDVVFEFRENPGVRWIFPKESVAEALNVSEPYD
ncbi:hypothetical protein HK096_002005, partial [Nowakowskiella sp. JEL0078]